MIAAITRVKNEGRWIAQSIESQLPLVSQLFVMDDGSTDDTVEICRRYPQVTVLPSPFTNLSEGRDKDWLLDQVVASGISAGDWLMFLDGDEALHPEDVTLVRKDIESGRANAYSLAVLYLWDRPDQMRTDGVYKHFHRPSLFRYEDGLRFLRTGNAGFHCSNVPWQLWGHCSESQARLLHYGYLHREDRIRKFYWYRERDGQNSIEDQYRHICIGDLPEYPANSVFRHGGPLRLEPLSNSSIGLPVHDSGHVNRPLELRPL